MNKLTLIINDRFTCAIKLDASQSYIVYLLILCCKLNPMTFNSYSQDVASFNIETFYKNETMLPEMG